MQKVNLYNGLLLPKPEQLPIQNLWLAIAAGVVIALGMWFMQWSNIGEVRKQHQTLISQKDKLKGQIGELESIIPSEAEKNKALNKIKKMQKQLKHQEQTSQLIAVLNKKQTAGYFGVMEDLSQLKKTKYWFTRIVLNSDQLSLEGKTYESASVANMINQLQNMPRTKKINFSKVIIEREKSQDRAASFYLFADSKGVVDEN